MQDVRVGSIVHGVAAPDRARWKNSKCITARFRSAATTYGSLMQLLILCQVEKAVHIGDPTKS